MELAEGQREDYTSRFAVLDHLPNGLMVVTRGLEVVYWNRCLEHWTGIEREKIVGTPLGQWYSHLGEARYRARIEAVFEGGPPTVFSSQLHGQLIPCRTRLGEQRVQQTTVTPLEDGEGGYWALFDIRDVTEVASQVRWLREAKASALSELKQRKDLEQKLSSAFEQLEQKNKEIESFAQTCSHDLKSPLWTVSGYCKLLANRAVSFADRDARDCVEHIHRGVDRMAKMIDGLLGYTLAGGSDRRMEQVDLGDVVVGVLEGLSGVIREAGVDIEVGDLPVVRADRVGVQQILMNLISNSVKFRLDGVPLRVQVKADRVEGYWEIAVVDNGIGIDPRFHERVFEPFKRLHTQHEYEGSGIGLAACRRAVERHGGRIWVESMIGEGSTFRFTLPAGDEGGDQGDGESNSKEDSGGSSGGGSEGGSEGESEAA